MGVFICYLFMQFLEKTAVKNNWKVILILIQLLQSGLYYEIIIHDEKIKTKLNLKMYFSQIISWVCVVCLTKFILFTFQLLVPGFLEVIGEFILFPLRDNGSLKLIFIMIIIPVCFNATQVRLYLINQFWVQDNILKFKGNKEISNEVLCDSYTALNIDPDSSSEGNKTEQILAKNKYFEQNQNNIL